MYIKNEQKNNSNALYANQSYISNNKEIAMKLNCVYTGSSTENLLLYHQIDLRQTRKLRGGQTMVDFAAADNCRLHVTIMKVKNFQVASPSISIDNFKSHYVQVFDLISTQDATENCQNPELVGQ